MDKLLHPTEYCGIYSLFHVLDTCFGLWRPRIWASRMIAAIKLRKRLYSTSFDRFVIIILPVHKRPTVPCNTEELIIQSPIATNKSVIQLKAYIYRFHRGVTVSIILLYQQELTYQSGQNLLHWKKCWIVFHQYVPPYIYQYLIVELFWLIINQVQVMVWLSNFGSKSKFN